MGIAIFFVVLIVIAIVLFFVVRSTGSYGSIGTILGADALRAKFGASATTPEASTP